MSFLGEITSTLPQYQKKSRHLAALSLTLRLTHRHSPGKLLSSIACPNESMKMNALVPGDCGDHFGGRSFFFEESSDPDGLQKRRIFHGASEL